MRVETPLPAPTIFVDADACPVKEEIYRVARRTGCPVQVVTNSFMRVPPDVTLTVVDAGPDMADDWIAERVKPRDIVVTNDIPLANRTLKAGGAALGATGKAFTEGSIGAALAQREIMEHLRSFGEVGGGPKPFSQADRSRFLSALDAAVMKAKQRV
jgi:uncharacterized protein YaiI (UPF0178 family)